MISIIKCKCPRCREGELFCDSNPYNLKKIFLMHHHCDSCGLIYNKEIGFFYGAMYVGYGLSIAYLVAIYVAMLVLIREFEVETYLLLSIGSLILLTPVVFRLSRSIWSSLFDKFDPKAVNKWKELNGDKVIDNPCIEV